MKLRLEAEVLLYLLLESLLQIFDFLLLSLQVGVEQGALVVLPIVQISNLFLHVLHRLLHRLKLALEGAIFLTELGNSVLKGYLFVRVLLQVSLFLLIGSVQLDSEHCYLVA